MTERLSVRVTYTTAATLFLLVGVALGYPLPPASSPVIYQDTSGDSTSSPSDSEWYLWINPQPTGNTLREVVPAPEGQGYHKVPAHFLSF